MLIIPAIDIKDGNVVRLFQGELSNKKVYSKDPVKTAKYWVRQGANIIHIVDLDGASSGIIKNLSIVKNITKKIPIPIQFGGGVRQMDTIKLLLDAGVNRVVLGTKAAEDKNFLKKAFTKFGKKIIVSIDAKDQYVLIKGWQESYKKLHASVLANTLKETGFKEFIYTDISKDGTLKGPNMKSIKSMLKETGMNIIASGGVSCLNDIYKLKLLEKQGITGIIIGKALYEKKFTLKQALNFA